MSDPLTLVLRFGIMGGLFTAHVLTSVAARQALGFAIEWRARAARPRAGGPDQTHDCDRIAGEWQTEADLLTAAATAAAVLTGAAAFWPLP